ncbi:MAG: pitrilysin family protein [Acidobacteriota bacterium]
MNDSLPFHIDLQRHTLDNGLRVVLHRDPRFPVVAVNLWYHVGSKNEAQGQTGFAHLFEHLLFQGSQHVDTNGHFRLVQQVGGLANGSTWYDRTNYHELMPSHHLDRALWLESDRMGFFLPSIHQEKLDTQREVVINERRQRVDNQPYGRAFERLNELLYPPGHPYRWPVIGYVEDIERATLDMVRQFFQTYYVPDNAVLTLAGDIEYDDALRRVERYFGEIPRGTRPIERPSPDPVVMAGEQRDVLEDDVKLPRIYMGFHAPPLGDDGWYTADLLAQALTSGRSSLLREDLIYRRRLAQDVTMFVLPTEETSTLGLIVTAKPGVSPDVLEAALDEHLANLAVEPLAEHHVEQGRNRIMNMLFDELQTLKDRANGLSRFTTFFDAPELLATQIDRYFELGAEDLRRFAEERLGVDQRAVVTVVPEAS